MLVGRAVDADEDRRLPLGPVGAIRLPLEETVVEHPHRMQVAGVHAADHPRQRGLLRFQMHPSAESKAEELLPVGKKEFFGGMHNRGKIEEEIGRVVDAVKDRAPASLPHANDFEGARQRTHESIDVAAIKGQPAPGKPGVVAVWAESVGRGQSENPGRMGGFVPA